MKILLLLIAGLVLFVGQSSAQKKIDVPAGSAVTISQTYKGGVSGGDTLFLEPGTRGGIRFDNIEGDPGNPIVVVNKSNSLKVEITNTNVGIRIVKAKHLKIIGRNVGGEKGIYIHHTNYQGIDVNDSSEYIEIGGIEVSHSGDGTNASISVKDDAANKDWVMHNISLHDLYIHDNKKGEGIYMGNTTQKDDRHTIENVWIYNNRLENISLDGIQGARTKTGKAWIHDNVIINVGIEEDVNQYPQQQTTIHRNGIQLGPEFGGYCYNNYLNNSQNPEKKAGSKGLQIQPEGPVLAYNNIIVGFPNVGIWIQEAYVNTSKRFYIFNNTVVNNGEGFSSELDDYDPSITYVMNNLWVGNSAPANDASKNIVNNKYYASKTDAGLSNTDASNLGKQPGDYKITSKSTEAIDKGVDIRTYSSTDPLVNSTLKSFTFDFAKTKRPSGNGYDIGAFEFEGNGDNQSPVANAGPDRSITLPTNSITINGSGSDPDGSITSYGWSKISGGNATLSGTNTATLTASSLSEGTYIFRLTVKDDKGASATDDVQVTVNGSPSGDLKVVYRVNNGGTTITASPVSWQEDKQGGVTSKYLDPSSYTLTTGSSTWTGSNGTGAPNNVFGGNRYNPSGVNMKWHFPVLNGKVQVKLFFAVKPGSSVDAIGQRVFDVNIENVLKLNDFDIRAKTGMAATVEIIETSVSDGMLDIEFIRVKGAPQVNAIEISAIGTPAAARIASPDFESFGVESGDGLHVYPNPSNGNIVFDLSDEKNEFVEVNIFDFSGALVGKVFSGKLGLSKQIDFDGSNLKEGIYIGKVKTNRGEKSKIIIVN